MAEAIAGSRGCRSRAGSRRRRRLPSRVAGQRHPVDGRGSVGSTGCRSTRATAAEDGEIRRGRRGRRGGTTGGNGTAGGNGRNTAPTRRPELLIIKTGSIAIQAADVDAALADATAMSALGRLRERVGALG